MRGQRGERAVVPNPKINALSSAFSAVVGVVFGIVPARHAAPLDTTEALRYE